MPARGLIYVYSPSGTLLRTVAGYVDKAGKKAFLPAIRDICISGDRLAVLSDDYVQFFDNLTAPTWSGLRVRPEDATSHQGGYQIVMLNSGKWAVWENGVGALRHFANDAASDFAISNSYFPDFGTLLFMGYAADRDYLQVFAVVNESDGTHQQAYYTSTGTLVSAGSPSTATNVRYLDANNYNNYLFAKTAEADTQKNFYGHGASLSFTELCPTWKSPAWCGVFGGSSIYLYSPAYTNIVTPNYPRWLNNHGYVIGDHVISNLTLRTYRCIKNHVSQPANQPGYESALFITWDTYWVVDTSGETRQDLPNSVLEADMTGHELRRFVVEPNAANAMARDSAGRLYLATVEERSQYAGTVSSVVKYNDRSAAFLPAAGEQRPAHVIGWENLHFYGAGDYVQMPGGDIYRCTASHYASTLLKPGQVTAGSWMNYWELSTSYTSALLPPAFTNDRPFARFDASIGDGGIVEYYLHTVRGAGTGLVNVINPYLSRRQDGALVVTWTAQDDIFAAPALYASTSPDNGQSWSYAGKQTQYSDASNSLLAGYAARWLGRRQGVAHLLTAHVDGPTVRARVDDGGWVTVATRTFEHSRYVNVAVDAMGRYYVLFHDELNGHRLLVWHVSGDGGLTWAKACDIDLTARVAAILPSDRLPGDVTATAELTGGPAGVSRWLIAYYARTFTSGGSGRDRLYLQREDGPLQLVREYTSSAGTGRPIIATSITPGKDEDGGLYLLLNTGNQITTHRSVDDGATWTISNGHTA